MQLIHSENKQNKIDIIFSWDYRLDFRSNLIKSKCSIQHKNDRKNEKYSLYVTLCHLTFKSFRRD